MNVTAEDLSWLKSHLLRPLGHSTQAVCSEEGSDEERQHEAAARLEAGRVRWKELSSVGALPSRWLETPPFLFSPNLGLFQMGSRLQPGPSVPPPSAGVADTLAAMGDAFDGVLSHVTRLRHAWAAWGVIRDEPAKLFLCAPTAECTVPSNLQYQVEVFEELVAVAEGRFSSEWRPTAATLEDGPAFAAWGAERWRWPRVCAEAAFVVRAANRAFTRASTGGRTVGVVHFEVEPGARPPPDFPAPSLRGRPFAELPNPLEPLERLFELGVWPLEVDGGGNVLVAVPEASGRRTHVDDAGHRDAQ